ncbi:ABC transporter ATP-binding protein [Microbacterium suwonense]|uniref:ABC transporter domain-containing protein n=1 Tax=Microbacterium suwonense TaxID=683047 RepID=A0ABM8FPX6_9MICO|nr:ATP-binding cassette domain-containing protein [Microbacterium suwonense]BDZ37455.1 hypothetical protein GCM10025863_00690 [Microbacterium suwonense]
MSGAVLDAQVRVDRGGFALDARLRAASGEIVAVMGPSGAGKSTLLGAIAGFTTLTGGTVRLDDTTVQDAGSVDVPARERGVILLGQQPRLFPHLSARDNIAFGPRARRVAKAKARADADTWLERIGLAGMGDRHPERLSGGQQQRVALARALATSPRVLLLDEPLTSLDPETADGIRSLLRDALAETRITTVLATHDATDAIALAGRLLVLEHGRVTDEGSPAAVLGAPATSFIAAVALNASASGDPWEAKVERVQTDADGIRVHARIADGTPIELGFPSGTPMAAGSTISIRPPAS